MAALPARLRIAAGVLTRWRCVPWGLYRWLDARALLVARGTSLDSRCVVFDVGANRGQTAKEIHRWLPGVDLHCFEPSPETFQRLRANVKDASLHPYGLGAQVGTHRMNPTGNDLTARIQDESESHVDIDHGSLIDVELSTVDAEMKNHGFERIDVLKIDVEGHEMSVLEGADQTLSDGRVDVILVETRFGSTGADWQTPFQDILEHLEARGFRMVGSYTNAIWLDHGINDADVLFVRVEGLPRDFSRSPLTVGT